MLRLFLGMKQMPSSCETSVRFVPELFLWQVCLVGKQTPKTRTLHVSATGRGVLSDNDALHVSLRDAGEITGDTP